MLLSCGLAEELHHLGSLGGGEDKCISVAGLAAVSVSDETCLFHTTKMWFDKQHSLLDLNIFLDLNICRI